MPHSQAANPDRCGKKMSYPGTCPQNVGAKDIRHRVKYHRDSCHSLLCRIDGRAAERERVDAEVERLLAFVHLNAYMKDGVLHYPLISHVMSQPPDSLLVPLEGESQVDTYRRVRTANNRLMRSALSDSRVWGNWGAVHPWRVSTDYKALFAQCKQSGLDGGIWDWLDENDWREDAMVDGFHFHNIQTGFMKYTDDMPEVKAGWVVKKIPLYHDGKTPVYAVDITTPEGLAIIRSKLLYIYSHIGLLTSSDGLQLAASATNTGGFRDVHIASVKRVNRLGVLVKRPQKETREVPAVCDVCGESLRDAIEFEEGWDDRVGFICTHITEIDPDSEIFDYAFFTKFCLNTKKKKVSQSVLSGIAEEVDGCHRQYVWICRYLGSFTRMSPSTWDEENRLFIEYAEHIGNASKIISYGD